MDDCSDDALRILARQHAFGGVGDFWRRCVRPPPRRGLAVRAGLHRAARAAEQVAFEMDGAGRVGRGGVRRWVPYYYELWRRVGRRGDEALALRAVAPRDALIVIAGGRFAYVVARATAPQALGDEHASNAAYVDAALAQHRRGDAEAMLGLEAGWGLAAGAWAVEAALPCSRLRF